MVKQNHSALKVAFSGFILGMVLFSGGILSCASGAKSVSVLEPQADSLVLYGDLGSQNDPVPFDAKVLRGALPNGLRYYIQENKKPEGRAFLRLSVDAGSVLETEDERGLAHFVEHMAFNGTERFPKNELIDYLRSLGMRFGPEINAYTSFDETVYGIEVPVSPNAEGKNMVAPRSLDIIEDWAGAISFNADDVDAERAVILEEYRTGLGAMDRIQRQTLPALFRGSPYADRLPIGLMEVVRTAPASRLAAFYKKWYRSDNMALIMVGDFDAKALEAELQNRFTSPKPETELKRPYYELPDPVPGTINLTVVTDPELNYGFVHLYYKRPPAPLGTDLHSYRESLIEALVNRMISLRFQEATSLPETPYAAAGTGGDRYGKKSRFYTISAVPEPGSTEASLAALLREKESVLRFGFSEAELERAKASLLSAYEKAAAEAEHRDSSSLADELNGHYLYGDVVPGIAWELRAARTFLEGIDTDQIQAAAASLFEGDELNVILVASEADAASLPTEDRVRELVAASKAEKLAAPVNERFDAELMNKVPVKGSVIGESEDKVSGTKSWVLSNGARVILKKTKNKSDEISLNAVARGGNSSVSDEDAISAAFSSAMLENSGLASFSVPELTKKLAGKQVSFSYWSGDYLRGLRGSSTSKDLQTLFQLLHLTFTQPRVDEAAVSAFLDRLRTSLLKRREAPEAVFSDAVKSLITGNHPRFAPLRVEDLDSISIEAARRILQNDLNAGDFTFVFVGNIDEAMLKPLVETYIASLPPKGAAADWKDLGILRPGKEELEVYKGKEDKSLVYLAWFHPVTYTEKRAAATAVLDGYLDIRLTEAIREKLGGVYSTSVSANLTNLPRGEQSLSISFSCDPKRADELVTAIQAELSLLREGTIDTDDLAKAKEALIKKQEEAIQNNTFLASSFANIQEVAQSPISVLYERPALYGQIATRDLREIASSLLDQGPARVTLYPEQKP